MKGGYAGRTMAAYGYVLPKAGLLLRLAAGLSAKAKYRLRIIDWHRANGENQSLQFLLLLRRIVIRLPVIFCFTENGCKK